jgi:hypothetical protein
VARYKRFWGMVALGSLIGIPYLWIRAGGEWWPFLPALIANFALLPWPSAPWQRVLSRPSLRPRPRKSKPKTSGTCKVRWAI